MATEISIPDQFEVPANASVGSPLATTINYTDTFGRTSCGISEIEHYRLHTLGLVRVIKSLTNSIDDVNRERSLVEEWRRVSRKGKTANGSELAVLQKLGDMTMAAAINRIAALKAEDYRLYVTKVSLDRTLAQIIEKQNIATCTEYFPRLKASLPQELQDIILGYIVDNWIDDRLRDNLLGVLVGKL